MGMRDYFKGKRVAVIGLGANGEMVDDVKFLIKAGALVSIYDLKSEARLKTHLVFLRTIGLANYVCGSIPSEDLIDMDLIILSHEYPRKSSFLKQATEKGIPIEYPETVLLKRAPPVTIIGVMGEAGKSTVISMLSPMLTESFEESEQDFFVIDAESGDGVIAKLKKIKNGDLVLMRLTEQMMKELHDIRISPHVAVFTTVPGPDAYDDSPFEILEFQTYNNYIVASDEVIDAARSDKDLPRSKMLRTKASYLPKEWALPKESAHDRESAALALQVARLFRVDDDISHHVLTTWKPLKGRIELIKKLKNIELYNDSASRKSCSTEIALRSIAKEKQVILVLGGAETACDYKSLYSILPQFVHTLILLPGSGTMKQRSSIMNLDGITVFSAPSLEEAARISVENAKKGDKILFSPGFEALGYDSNRKERGERFVRALRSL